MTRVETSVRGATQYAEREDLAMAGNMLTIEEVGKTSVLGFAHPGALESEHAEQISRELYGYIDRVTERNLVIDFANAQFASSRALGVLLTLRLKAARAACEVALAGLNSNLQHLFELTNLAQIFEIHPNRQSALARFADKT